MPDFAERYPRSHCRDVLTERTGLSACAPLLETSDPRTEEEERAALPVRLPAAAAFQRGSSSFGRAQRPACRVHLPRLRQEKRPLRRRLTGPAKSHQRVASRRCAEALSAQLRIRSSSSDMKMKENVDDRCCSGRFNSVRDTTCRLRPQRSHPSAARSVSRTARPDSRGMRTHRARRACRAVSTSTSGRHLQLSRRT